MTDDPVTALYDIGMNVAEWWFASLGRFALLLIVAVTVTLSTTAFYASRGRR